MTDRYQDAEATRLERHEFGTPSKAIPKGAKCPHCNRAIRSGQGWERVVDSTGEEIVRHTMPLYFDECTDGETRKTLRRMGFCLVPTQKGAGDREWLERAGQEGWTVITTDARILTVPEEREAIEHNGVRCFVISPQPDDAWGALLAFSEMWRKIRLEAAFPGPAVWVRQDESSASRWRQVLPEPLDYAHIGLSKTPVGHLLNFFADIVVQHDAGWFSQEFVNALHDEIRTVVESRYGPWHPRTPPAPPAQGDWQNVAESDAGEPIIDFPTPVSQKHFRVFHIGWTSPEGEEYPWLIASHAIRSVPVSDDDPERHDPNRSFKFDFGPTGFRRSGIGLR